jgi:hypothetical protein
VGEVGRWEGQQWSWRLSWCRDFFTLEVVLVQKIEDVVLSLRVCLFPKKEEGKIVMGWKVHGNVHFL